MRISLFVLALSANVAMGSSATDYAPMGGSLTLVPGIQRVPFTVFATSQPSAWRPGGDAIAKIDEFPWQVSLILTGHKPWQGHFCSGVIVAPQWVLTAAHCVASHTEAKDLFVLAAANRLSAGGTRHSASRIVIHENWDSQSMVNDIALVRLNSHASGRPIALASIDPFPGSSGVVSGWGEVRVDRRTHDQLRKSAVSIVADRPCNSARNYAGAVTENMLCAESAGSKRQSCYGDGGSPLLSPVWKPELVGILSWADCGQGRKPAVYTRVSKYARWVADKMK